MRLFLIRHGTAEKREPDHQDSPNRRLVEKGQQQIRALSSLLASFVNDHSYFCTSPYLRAVESAIAFTDFVGIESAVEQTDTLTPDASPAAFVEFVRSKHKSDLETEQSIFAFGHEPFLSECVSTILGAKNLSLRVKKGGAVEIRFDENCENPNLLGLLRPRYYPML